jgi:hypothetical protein
MLVVQFVLPTDPQEVTAQVGRDGARQVGHLRSCTA